MIRFAVAVIPRRLCVRESAPVYGASPAVADGSPEASAGTPVSVDAAAAAGSPVRVPDPFDDADALEELGDEIATLSAHIHAAQHRLLMLIAEFDRHRGWELAGHRSCAYWLAERTRIDLATAREKVRVARALVGLPRSSAAMARGELSFSSVRALTRVATPENEADLLELAGGSTTAQLERLVRAYRRGSRRDEAERERDNQERRTFSVFPDEEGMYVVRGVLPPEVAAALMRAVEAASDALFRETWGEVEIPDDTGRAAARRRADAVGLVAERALAAGFGAADGTPVSGSRAERYQVMIHVDAQELATGAEEEEEEEDAEPVGAAGVSREGSGSGPLGAGAEGGRAAPDVSAEPSAPRLAPIRPHLPDGTRLSHETVRRLACDCAVVRVTHAPDGSVLHVGRKTRSIPPALRRALEVRDGGCRFPGCGMRFTDGHHVAHWADGGPTSLANCLLLCRFHHRLVHEGGWRMGWWGKERPVFYDPRGGTHFDGRWEPPALSERPVVALVTENLKRGTNPDGWTAGARWKRERDIPDDVLFRAAEALQ